jgi:hypothetical protein
MPSCSQAYKLLKVSTCMLRYQWHRLHGSIARESGSALRNGLQEFQYVLWLAFLVSLLRLMLCLCVGSCVELTCCQCCCRWAPAQLN